MSDLRPQGCPQPNFLQLRLVLQIYTIPISNINGQFCIVVAVFVDVQHWQTVIATCLKLRTYFICILLSDSADHKVVMLANFPPGPLKSFKQLSVSFLYNQPSPPGQNNVSVVVWGTSSTARPYVGCAREVPRAHVAAAFP